MPSDDHVVMRGNWLDGRWHGWYVLDGAGFNPAAKPTAVARDADRMDVWAVDPDGRVRGIHFLDGSWRTWLTFGGATFPRGGRLASVSRHHDHMELFAVDANGVLQRRSFEGSWAGWQAFPGAFVPGAAVATASRHADRLEVWVVGRDDGVVRGNWYDGDNWQGWYRLDASATFRPDGDLTAVSRSHVPGGAGPFASLPGARGPEAMEVWGVDGNGTVRGAWFDGQWHPWYALVWSFEG